MSETTTWRALFDEYHRVVKGAGEVLRDAERLMMQRNFKSANPMNTAGTDSSLHMDTPEKWAPGWFARFYKLDAHPTLFSYVAVFLHDRGGSEDFSKTKRLDEPLIVAGFVRSATAEPCEWRYWHAKYWFWSNGVADGPALTHKLEAKNKYGQATNTCFAVRLERVRGLGDIQQLVVDPLMKLIG